MQISSIFPTPVLAQLPPYLCLFPHQGGTFVIIDETTLICRYYAQPIYFRVHP